MATLSVRNIGPIREADFEVKKHTVFIGPQGSGKSTLAKLIAIGGDAGHVPFVGLTDDSMLEKYGLEKYISLTSSMVFNGERFDLSFSRRFSLTVKDKYNSIFLMLLSEVENLYKVIDDKFKPTYDLPAPQAKDIISNYQSGRKELLAFFDENILITPSTYVISERSLISLLANSLWSLNSSRINLPQVLTLFGSFFEDSRNHLGKLFMPFLPISYQYDQGFDKVLHNTEEVTALSQSASGYQSIIPLLLVVEHQRKTSKRRFIIEEPELNLYPTTQKDLIYNLMSGLDPAVTYQEAEWVITTHSPYVLSSFNTLMLAWKVAQRSDELRAEVEKIIPARSWINPDEFAAYYVDNGTVESIVSPETGLINDSRLDDMSENFAGERDFLFDLYRSAEPRD